ncbi:helix-turn-helix domain-containing protein [Streptomyces sp. W16]|uniref:TetR/AcrR family transcriptional regulator n=1 Tax=Streptomyces sp. W16 TaxID=3076631 RepID=UPI00295B9DA7|nr:helix-turn-helix domain-containing protein [Streptomyces sp. W16]MDV9171418.1 helix-turn-helix domain-containing protein [Streptomyces sp. W16]
MAEPAEPGRAPLRRDAELNRRRLMAAAREVFRDRGLAATLDDVARHAGLGVGTAYRHFANKEELVDAVFEDMIDRVEACAREAAADPDPWRGLAASLEKVCELQAHDRGLREVMLGTGKAAQRHALIDRRIKPLVDPLIDRAKEQGALRADVEPLDFPMIQLMVGAITDQTGEPDLWRRYLRMLLDGMRSRPDGADPLPPGPTSHPL